DRIARLEAAFLDLAEMHEKIAELLLRVGHAEKRTFGAFDDTLVSDLTTALAVERRLVEDERAFIAGLERADCLAARDKRRDDAFRRLGVIAEEFRRADLILDLEPQRLGRGLARTFPGSFRGVFLLLHRRVESFRIDGNAARLQSVFR